MSEQRMYPDSCARRCRRTGHGTEKCPGCTHWPELRDFLAWANRTGAVPADPLWQPRVYRVPSSRPGGCINDHR